MAPRMPTQAPAVPGRKPTTPRLPPKRAAKKALYWLASYPKSGNTWTRIFLANYLFDRKTPMPINQVHRIGMGDAIPKAYAPFAVRPFNPADQLQALEIRPRFLNSLASGDADLMFVKTH
ncbi:MAG: hypothetical protein AAFN05_17580, partial [Pseudomonadota bacterium]